MYQGVGWAAGVDRLALLLRDEHFQERHDFCVIQVTSIVALFVKRDSLQASKSQAVERYAARVVDRLRRLEARTVSFETRKISKQVWTALPTVF